MHKSLIFFGMKFYMFRTIPLSIIRRFHCKHSNGNVMQFAIRVRTELSTVLILLASCQQTCMTYTTAVCTVKNC